MLLFKHQFCLIQVLIRHVFIEQPPVNPCQPSPCGPNSQCRINNGVAVCSCQTGYIGSPPSCRPECVVSAECPLTQACLNNKCRDPCPGTCGINAQCQVLNHNPICSCTQGNTGDPFTRCYPLPKGKLTHLTILIHIILNAFSICRRTGSGRSVPS